MGITLDETFERGVLGIRPNTRPVANGANGSAHSAQPAPTAPAMTVAAAEDALSLCGRVRADRVKEEEQAALKYEKLDGHRQEALSTLRLMEAAFGRDQGEPALLALVEAREKFSAIDGATDSARKDWQERQQYLATAMKAVASAEKGVRIAKLREQLVAPRDASRMIQTQRKHLDAKREAETARIARMTEIETIFTWIDADESACAGLEEDGQHVGPTAILHLGAPLLLDLAGAGLLRVDARPDIGDYPPGSGTNHRTWRHGPHASALDSLRPLADAMRKRDGVAVLSALDALTGEADEETSEVALKLAELLQANRDNIAIMDAVDEADEPARVAYEAAKQASEQRQHEEEKARFAYSASFTEAAKRRGAPHRTLL